MIASSNKELGNVNKLDKFSSVKPRNSHKLKLTENLSSKIIMVTDPNTNKKSSKGLLETKIKSNINTNKVFENNKKQEKADFNHILDFLEIRTSEISIPMFLNENPPLTSNEKEYFYYALLSERERKIVLDKIRLVLRFIDMILILMNITLCTLLYFDHFNYIKNQYLITSDSNQIRFLCLIISVLITILLVQRNKNIRTREVIKFYLNYSLKPVIKDLFSIKLFIEIILHFLQPLPYISYKFEMYILGNPVTYSVNMLLFLLSTLRFYYFYYIIDKMIIFSSEQAKRIYIFLTKKSNIFIIIKSILKYYGLVSLFILFITITYIYGLYFKVMEDYKRDDSENKFKQIVNCIWYIIVTMTSIGYGDIVPLTLVGRIIGVICCISGIFFIAMIFVFLFLYTNLDDDEYLVSILLI